MESHTWKGKLILLLNFSSAWIGNLLVNISKQKIDMMHFFSAAYMILPAMQPGNLPSSSSAIWVGLIQWPIMGSTPSAVWHTVWYLSGVTIHVFDSTRATSCKFRSVHVYNLEGMLVSKFSINHCLEQVNRNLVIFRESNDYILK